MTHYYQTDIECPKCNSTVTLDVSEEGVDVLGATVPTRIDQLEKALKESQAYADKLAEGLPMLPKDVEVIRTANVHLADDVCRLEKALREIRSDCRKCLNDNGCGFVSCPIEDIALEALKESK